MAESSSTTSTNSNINSSTCSESSSAIASSSSSNSSSSSSSVMAGKMIQYKNTSPLTIISIVRGSPYFAAIITSNIIEILPDEIITIVAEYSVSNHYLAVEFEKRIEWKKAFQYYNRSMEEDSDADATYKCAFIYLYGFNTVYIDEKKAVALLKLAIERGSVNAHSMLAVCGCVELGMMRDDDFFSMMIAEEKDIYEVLLNVRYIRMFNRNPTNTYSIEFLQKEQTALSQLQLLADNGDVRALTYCAHIWAEGSHGCDEDMDKSNRYWLAAAEQGSAMAQRTIGLRYERGTAESTNLPNLEKAFHYYSLAATQGEGEAMCYLGEYFLFGMYVKPDRDKAKEWLQRAISTHNFSARSRAKGVFDSSFA